MLYDRWTQMLQRCENPNNSHYHLYGGRGIKVCERWHDFALFRADVEATYREGLTIDRERNNEGYEPGNFRWATYRVQARNQRKTIMVEWFDKPVPLVDLAEQHGVRPMTAYSRFKLKGWSVRQALGLDAPPQLNRPPISEATRLLMRDAALRRWERRA